MLRYAIVLVCIIIAGFAANALQPILHKTLPSDFSRTNFLLQTLMDENSNPEVMVFGNSIAMSGIDASLIKQEFDLERAAYNLASNGQYFSETLLYFPLIKDDCKLVIQMVRSIELEQELQKLDQAVLRNFYFGSYPIDKAIDQKLEVDIGLDYLRDNHVESLKYDQRGTTVNAFNNIFRSKLREDLDLEKLKTELYFPNVYTNKVSDEVMTKMVKLHNPIPAKTSFTPNESKLKLVKDIQAYFQSKGIEYVLVLFPFNPVLDNFTSDYMRSINAFAVNSTLPVISLVDVLDEADFVDHCHVNRDGAKMLTQLLINKLKQQGYAF